MMVFLLLAATAPVPSATCDAKPFTLKKAPVAQTAKAAPPPPAPKPKTEAKAKSKPIADCDKPAKK